ncbi:MAG: AI-2E family transporter [Bacteroidota bacterium]|nr:AI-2E family transporter [Bacteroidota bacterium]
MQDNPYFKFPFYIKASIFLIGLYTFIDMLYIARNIIVPVIYATIIAIVLSPLVNFLEKKKINRVIAVLCTMIPTILIIAGLSSLLIKQASRFGQTFPKLIKKFYIFIDQITAWASLHFNISDQNINEWLTKTQDELFKHGGSFIGNTLSTMGNMLIFSLIILFYIFLLLYYEPLIIEFIHRLFDKNNGKEVKEILAETKTLIRSYLTGLLIEAVIVAVLYSTGLFVIGIDYAIMLGVMAALLNFIPYLGGIITLTITLLIAFFTKESPSYMLFVFILYLIIHILDNTFILPKIVASKVKLNVLVSVTVILLGNYLWGVAGLLISIPVTGIIKLIFDHIESLKPIGFLLGKKYK